MSVHLARGTRDHLPSAMHGRLHVMDTVRRVFGRFGFEPLETPAFERLETLMGKYGDEGDRLVFRILARGEGGLRGETDLALRYDLTVPLARVVAMNPELRMPFKRYQMQPVWRADRPQRGRYREFYQCDVDVVGTESRLAEAECLAVVSAALTELGFDDFTIRLNDRRILHALAIAVGAADRETDLLVALDKLDKIGREGVSAELSTRGFTPESVARVWDHLAPADNPLDALDERLGDPVRPATDALREIVGLCQGYGCGNRLRVDPTLARGLDYYTGPVYEVVVDQGDWTISAGGRYDGLIGMFSGRPIPAAGVSLGIERILVLMEERGSLARHSGAPPVLVTVFDEERRPAAVRCATSLRAAAVPTDLFVGSGKLKAQFKYADARGCRFVVVVGPDEEAAGEVTVKDLASGAQERLSLDAAVQRVARELLKA